MNIVAYNERKGQSALTFTENSLEPKSAK
jgi:hypothetical protein